MISLLYNQVSIYSATSNCSRDSREHDGLNRSVDIFVKDAKQFLDAHAEHRPDGFPDAMFAQFRPHRRPRGAGAPTASPGSGCCFDNGFAGLTWPTRSAAAACRRHMPWRGRTSSRSTTFREAFSASRWRWWARPCSPSAHLSRGAIAPQSCAAMKSGASCSVSPARAVTSPGSSTRAHRTESGWRVNGQKVWTSEARHAKYGYLLARTDPSQPRHKGLTAFVVDMSTPGVEVRPLQQMTGGASFSEVFFDDVDLPADAVLGEVGGGWSVAMTTLGFERFSSFGRSLGRLVRQAAELGWDDRVARERLHRRGHRPARTRRVRGRYAPPPPRRQPPGPEAALAKLATGTVVSSLADAVADQLGIPARRTEAPASTTGAWCCCRRRPSTSRAEPMKSSRR